MLQEIVALKGATWDSKGIKTSPLKMFGTGRRDNFLLGFGNFSGARLCQLNFGRVNNILKAPEASRMLGQNSLKL